VVLYIENGKQEGKKSSIVPLRLLRWVTRLGYATENDALEFLTYAMDNSAPYTHARGNRRFNDLLLTIENGALTNLSVLKVNCVACNDTKTFKAFEPDGTVNFWRCPDCYEPVDKQQTRKHYRNSTRRY
jgi:hypothetical protein